VKKPSKKSKIVQITKVRMREELKDQLIRSATRNKRTQNGELVHRLEQSFAQDAKDAQELRDSGILDMMLMNNDLSGALVRNIAKQLAKNPNWRHLKAAQDLLETLSHSEQPGDDQ
jgi:hypothetical protein